MTPLVLALSAINTLVKVGAYAGYASILGLAVLSMLYFAQAREVKRLREWAGRSPERDAELAQRVGADVQRRVVATPMAPATTAAQQAEANRAAAAAALYAKVVPAAPPAPLVGPPGQLARPVAPGAVPGTATVPPAVPPLPPLPPVPGQPAPGSVPGATTTTTPAPGSVPGATAVTPAAAAQQAALASRTATPFGNGSGQDTHESAAARPDPLEGPLPLDGFTDPGGGFTPGRMTAMIGGGVAAVLVAIVLLVVLSSGGDKPQKPNELGVVTTPASTPASSSGGTATTTTAAAPPGVDRAATNVAVLNGTKQTGLARTIADQIEKAKFTISGTGNNADQAVPATTVSYRAGQQKAAQIIAKALGIDSTSVEPVDANTSAAADADVIVIVGADKIG